LHSYHSDGVYSPSLIVGYAKISGIKLLSITDHNEIRGTLWAMHLAERLGLIYFPGIELMFTVNGRVYELLAYFNQEAEIRGFYQEYRYSNGFMPSFGSVSEVVVLIKKYRGAIIAPHPFGRKGIYRRGRNSQVGVDGLEVINGFTGDKRNLRALSHLQNNQKVKRIASSDMHFFLSDIKRTYTEISGQDLGRENIWQNLLGLRSDLIFRPLSGNYLRYKTGLQKALCAVVYALNYPRLYLSYFFGKRSFKKNP